MKHPILKSKNRILIYILLWIIPALIQFVLVYEAFPGKSRFILLGILIQNSTLAFMLLGAWYGLRYLNIETQKPAQFISNHLVYMLLIGLLWVMVSNFFDTVLIGNMANAYAQKVKAIKTFLGFFSYLLYVAYMYLDNYHTSFVDKINNEKKLYEILKESELNLLKSQMNPHFIFNSLNSISSLTLLDPTRAQEMIIKLSDFLRYTVNASQNQVVTLERELEMCRAYLDIEKVRFGNKISFNLEVAEEALVYKIPSMMLQTLFENAVKHGVHNSVNAETINFSASVLEGWLVLNMENSFDPDAAAVKGTKTGLANVKKRLGLIYGNQALMTAGANENKYIVNLNLPAIHEN